ncbi:hypothetical protein [Pedobacter sp.]
MKKRNKRYKGGSEFDHPLFRAPGTRNEKMPVKKYRLWKILLMMIAGLILLLAVISTAKHYYGHVSGDLQHKSH